MVCNYSTLVNVTEKYVFISQENWVQIVVMFFGGIESINNAEIF